MTSGPLELPRITAGTRSKVPLPKKIFKSQDPLETWLTVTFRQRHHTPWAEAGHVIAWAQAQLYPHDKPHRSVIPDSEIGQRISFYDERKYALTLAPADPTYGSLTLTETPVEYKVSNENFLIAFDRFRGHITGWMYNGIPLLQNSKSDAPLLTLDFWRPPTNNDMAWQTGEWKRFGLDMMTSRLISFKFMGNNVQELHDGRKTTGFSFQAIQDFAPPILAWSLEVVTTYTVIADWGSLVPFTLQIHTDIEPNGHSPPNLPRVGHNIQLSSAYNHVSWFGFGPGESYNDKYSSQQVGIWEKVIDDMGTSYEVPQENGNRIGTRWCTVSSKNSEKKEEEKEEGYVHVSSQPDADVKKAKDKKTTTMPSLRATFLHHKTQQPRMPYATIHHQHFQFSTQQYDASTLEKVAHPCDLDEAGARREGALWRVDADNAGVGTAACGPGVYERDQVTCEPRQWTLQLDVVLP